MKEPLLPAVIADEPEPSVPHEPLDDPVRHVDNLRGPCRTALRATESKFCSNELAKPALPGGSVRFQLSSSGLQRQHIGRDGLRKPAIGGEHD